MYNEENKAINFDLPKNQSNVIKVIGVGGGGSNAINYMYNKGINGVDYVICNTDAQALENSPVPNKVQLGINLTEGMGAGADPKIGEKAAIESLDVLKKMLDKNTIQGSISNASEPAMPLFRTSPELANVPNNRTDVALVGPNVIQCVRPSTPDVKEATADPSKPYLMGSPATKA